MYPLSIYSMSMENENIEVEYILPKPISKKNLPSFTNYKPAGVV